MGQCGAGKGDTSTLGEKYRSGTMTDNNKKKGQIIIVGKIGNYMQLNLI